MSKKRIITPVPNENGEYTFGNKKYILGNEIVKGGCQGCAFYNKMDCYDSGKTEICTKQHKIFIYKIDSLD